MNLKYRSAFTGPYDNNRAHSLLAPNQGSGSPRSSIAADAFKGREGMSNVIVDDSIQLAQAVHFKNNFLKKKHHVEKVQM